jgi:hypothetical protein
MSAGLFSRCGKEKEGAVVFIFRLIESQKVNFYLSEGGNYIKEEGFLHIGFFL